MVWKVGPDEDVASTAHNRKVSKALLISIHTHTNSAFRLTISTYTHADIFTDLITYLRHTY